MIGRLHLFSYGDDRTTYDLVLKDVDGDLETLEVTDNHPFNVVGQGWLDSIDLVAGMQVPNVDDGLLTVVSLTPLEASPVTYNMTVADHHTYFVGEMGALVHNQNQACNECSLEFPDDNDSSLDDDLFVNEPCKSTIINCGDYKNNAEELHKLYTNLVPQGRYSKDEIQEWANLGATFNKETKRFSLPKKKPVDVPALNGKPVETKAAEGLSSSHKRLELNNIKVEVKTADGSIKEMNVEAMVAERNAILKQKQALKEESGLTEGERSISFNKLNLQQIRFSEAIDEAAAKQYGESLKDFKSLEARLPGNGKSGEFDKIFSYSVIQLFSYLDDHGETRIMVIEAKGGASRLGSRYDGDRGGRVEQGTQAYLDSIIANMEKVVENRDPLKIKTEPDYKKRIEDLQETMNTFLLHGDKVDYHVINQKFDKVTGARLDPSVTNYLGN